MQTSVGTKYGRNSGSRSMLGASQETHDQIPSDHWVFLGNGYFEV